MDFNYKLACKNAELFKCDLSNGMRVTDLEVIGRGSAHMAYSYENLVIKEPINEWAKSRDQKETERKYNKLLVRLSANGMEQNLDFAPVLDFAKLDNRFLTISPFIGGTELPDCTDEQLAAIGVSGMKKYLKNNHKLAKICLPPEFHDVRNFKLTAQGNISVIDFSTWSFPLNIQLGNPIKSHYTNKHKKSVDWKSVAMITLSSKDKRVLGNLRAAFEQIPNSKAALKFLDYYK